MSVIANVRTLRPPAPSGGRVGHVRISPDALRLAFTVDGGSAPGVYVAAADGSGTERLLSYDGWRAFDVAWSPDGSHIAYLVGLPDVEPGGGDAVAWAASDPKSATPGELGRTPGMAFCWTPKGMALLTADVESKQVARCDLATGKTAKLADLADDGDPLFAPRVVASPDGTRVVFTCRRVRDACSEVWIVARDQSGGGVAVTLLTEVPGAGAFVLPFWSPKGVTLGLFVVHSEAQQTAMIVVPRLQGEGDTLYTADRVDPGVTPAWSPSGRSISFFVSQGGERLVLLDCQTQAVADAGAPDVAGEPHFLDDRTLAVDGGAAAHLLTFASPP